MIPGNVPWNFNVAAMTAHSRPLYTFEIPDEGIILTTFAPDEANVTVDLQGLVTQALWYRAAIRALALKSVSLYPTSGHVIVGDDGTATITPPAATVVRSNFGSAITGTTAYLGWNGISCPPGMQDIAKAITLDLVLVSSLIETAGYTPYGSVGYQVLQVPAALATWFSALNDDTAGWVNRTTTLRLWPGNADVTVFPDINNIQIQIGLTGTATGSAPAGITFIVSASLVVGFP